MSLRNLLSGSADSGSGAGGGSRSSLRSRFFSTLAAIERDLWVLAIAAMAGDVALTMYGLDIGLEETNPVARRALDGAGILGLSVLKMLALFVGGCGRAVIPDRANAVVPIALGIPSLCAVVINATLIVTVSL